LTSSSTTSLTCQLSSSNSQLQSNVQYPVEVLVKNFGYALQSSTYLITFVPVITSFTPTSGSIVGGTQITINGLGFSSSGYVQFGCNWKSAMCCGISYYNTNNMSIKWT